MAPHGIVFDLDGTLTDSKPGLFASLRHMHAVLEWEQPTDEALQAWLGPPVAQSLQEAGHDEETIERALSAFRDRLETGLLESSLYPGIDALLAGLDGTGRPLAVATFKVQPDARRVIDHYGLGHRFRGVHGRSSELLGHSKAAVIEQAVASIGLDASDVVMVGDREHDIASAAELGIRGIGVAYGYGSRAELEAAGAWRVVDSVDELRAALR
jgi:phosphoglycolate phosphatase